MGGRVVEQSLASARVGRGFWAALDATGPAPATVVTVIAVMPITSIATSLGSGAYQKPPWRAGPVPLPSLTFIWFLVVPFNTGSDGRLLSAETAAEGRLPGGEGLPVPGGLEGNPSRQRSTPPAQAISGRNSSSPTTSVVS